MKVTVFILVTTMALVFGINEHLNEMENSISNESVLMASNPSDIGDKVIICHIPPGNPDNAHTIEISVNALQAHLAHGDSLGSCNTNDDGDINDDRQKEETETDVIQHIDE